ncbi:alpha/beta fold hydrolase [Epidermidibacterium keratini]|uniref:Alpha/beta fold hydrolase n=1 Tax=Epidermidibacterium keratini TaxID=1891644 RepID=A0A7L4YNM0_9ACTN|nr:alpha/beta hydrolase [Epidermidibacterium keratini]QHC00736.1 alpha/beta fold hydrolase [Epidermidibacterium keratini]
MLEYQRTGDGAPVVAIHGFLSSWEVWDRIAPQLDPEYDVIQVNLPGHGGAPIPPVTTTIRDISRHIVETLDELEIDKATFIGHSWGGYVTCELIASHPERVEAAAIVYSNPYSDTGDKRDARDALIARFESEPFDDVIADALPAYVTPDDPPELLEGMVELAKQSDADGAIFALRSIRDRLDHVPEIMANEDIPVLFIAGTQDESMPEITVEAPNVTTVETASGHMGVQTIPDEVSQILLEWMTKNREAKSTEDDNDDESGDA